MKFTVQPGHEVRGFMIRLYPDEDTVQAFETLSKDLRRAWNWLCVNNEDALKAREAFAVRQGLVGPRPERPNYDGLSPEESKAAKKAHAAACCEWSKSVHEATKDIPGCGPRRLKELLAHYGDKNDYQLLTRVIGWAYDPTEARPIKPGAHMLQALTKNFYSRAKGQRRKKFRRQNDTMPLQVRSGDCFKLGNFGERRGNPFYNCQVSINGLKIRGRLPGKTPSGRVLEGVSITKLPDGWYASIKQEIPIRAQEPANPGTVIGIDVGLDNIAAMSDGRRVTNDRGKAYAERIAGRQAMKLPVGRLHQAAARHTKHKIYNEIIKPLANVETIKVEHLTSNVGQLGSKKVSVMRTVVELLRDRYGDRVREVDCRFTSQDCSQCGHRSKESWSYEHGRYGKCPVCGYQEDRDVNAARNVAARPPIKLGS